MKAGVVRGNIGANLGFNRLTHTIPPTVYGRAAFSVTMASAIGGAGRAGEIAVSVTDSVSGFAAARAIQRQY